MSENSNINDLEDASEIFYYLLKHKRLNIRNNRVLFEKCSNPIVQRCLKIMLGKSESDFRIINDTVYLLPDRGNTTLGYSGADIKERMFIHNADATDYYLGQFIIKEILGAFYSSTHNELSRTQLSIYELENMVSESLKNASERNDLEAFEKTYRINFSDIIVKWNSLKGSDSSTKKKEYRNGFVRKVTSFLEKEKLLLSYEVDGIIKPSQMLTDKMHFILSKSEFKKAEKMFEQLRMKDELSILEDE